MGQQPNKYHISDDGRVFRINDDGSFTSVCNIEDVDKKSSAISVDNESPIPTPEMKMPNSIEIGWWKRNYNWLWITNLVLFIGWFISCLSCSWPDYPVYNENGFIVSYYHATNLVDILVGCMVILLCYTLSWYLSSKNKMILKLIQILFVGFACWVARAIYWLCDMQYSLLILSIAIVSYSIWVLAICLSLFSRKKV